MHQRPAIKVQQVQVDLFDIHQHLQHTHLIVHQLLFVGFASWTILCLIDCHALILWLYARKTVKYRRPLELIQCVHFCTVLNEQLANLRTRVKTLWVVNQVMQRRSLISVSKVRIASQFEQGLDILILELTTFLDNSNERHLVIHRTKVHLTLILS